MSSRVDFGTNSLKQIHSKINDVWNKTSCQYGVLLKQKRGGWKRMRVIVWIAKRWDLVKIKEFTRLSHAYRLEAHVFAHWKHKTIEKKTPIKYPISRAFDRGGDHPGPRLGDDSDVWCLGSVTDFAGETTSAAVVGVARCMY